MASLVGPKVSSGGVVNEEEKLSSSDMRRSLLGEYQTPLVRSCDLVLMSCDLSAILYRLMSVWSTTLN